MLPTEKGNFTINILQSFCHHKVLTKLYATNICILSRNITGNHLLKNHLCINWKVVALQYCDSFCHQPHELAMGKHMSPSWFPFPPRCPPHPPRCCRARAFWVPCIKHQTRTGYLFYIWWCTCFNALLWNRSTLSFPAVSQSLFFMSVSPLLPCTWGHQYYFSRSHNKC